MLPKLNYSRWINLAAWVVVLMVSVGMAEVRLSTLRCENLVVDVDSANGMHFLTQNEVEAILTNGGSEPLQGNRLSRTNLNILETRVKNNRLVKDCQIVSDLNGDLIVKVEQRTPIARYVQYSTGQWRKSPGQGYYIDGNGRYLPLSDRFTARVMLVSGPYFNRYDDLSSEITQPVMNFLKYVNSHKFWKSQIDQIFVSGNGEISFSNIVGKQRIEFGPPEGIEDKFKKLLIFYDKVLKMEWNRYSRISVKYKNQVVCE